MRVREKAWIEKSNGIYNVKTNSGAISYYSNYEDAMSHVNYVNNEDSKGHYFDDGRLSEEEEELLRQERQREWEMQQARIEAQAKRSAERKEKEEKKAENNRKSKRSNDKYIYVISFIERGYKYTEYFKGQTNLMTMKGSFTTYEAKDAKVFQTKASAQKMVDILTKNYLVKKLYRNIKVVQKKREIFAAKS